MLKAVAKGVNEFLSSKAIMDKFKLGTSANVIKIKDVLIKKEIIDVINKKIVFLDAAFELWFKNN